MTPSRNLRSVLESTWFRRFAAFIRRALLGAAAGGVAGIVIGGVGGRLAMLLLRFTSPDSVRGIETDDGFEIGVVTLDTFNLILTTWLLGAVAGLFVALSLRYLSWSWMPLAWAAPGATIGGAALVSSDGVDFTLLEPTWLAVALFLVIPAAGLAATALLIRQWEAWWWVRRRRTAAVALAAGPVVALFPVGLVVLAFAMGWASFSQLAVIERFNASRLAQRAAAAAFACVTLGFVPASVSNLQAVF